MKSFEFGSKAASSKKTVLGRPDKYHRPTSFEKNRASKHVSKSKKKKNTSFRDGRRPPDLDLARVSSIQLSQLNLEEHHADLLATTRSHGWKGKPIIVQVGSYKPQRQFVTLEDVLFQSSFLKSALRSSAFDAEASTLHLTHEIPEAFGYILEYLTCGDYYPKLLYREDRRKWILQDLPSPATPGSPNSAIWVPPAAPRSPALPHSPFVHLGEGNYVLRDTVLYCMADRYGLQGLKQICLRKQGLLTGVSVNCLIDSMTYAYKHTSARDSKLRSAFLALVIRSRTAFRKSATMQRAMGLFFDLKGNSDETQGTAMWFDLFCALCNHIDDVEEEAKTLVDSEAGSRRTSRFSN